MILTLIQNTCKRLSATLEMSYCFDFRSLDATPALELIHVIEGTFLLPQAANQHPFPKKHLLCQVPTVSQTAPPSPDLQVH